MSESKTNGNLPDSEENISTVDGSEPEQKKPGRKKLIIIIAAAVVLIAAAIILIVTLTGSGDNEDADDDIEYIDVQTGNYYSGVIEPQQTSDVSKDADRTVSDVYVKVGDTVKKGDKLFAYDSDETATKLSKAKIEYTGIQNDIIECENSITQLTRQRSEADASMQAEFTSQISEKESSKSQLELNLKIKQVEIDNLQNSLDNSVVTSPIDGIIKQINSTGDSSNNAYMTILMNGTFRVKGQVDEMNVRSLAADTEVIVHSRTVKDKTWKGTITKVDTGNTADKRSNVNDSGSDNSATNYYFYVSLDSSDGLLLGEHVYIETANSYAEEEAPVQEEEATQAENASDE